MAKKKRQQKATQAPQKPAQHERPSPDTPTASPTKNASAGEASTDREILEGSDQTRLFRDLFSELRGLKQHVEQRFNHDAQMFRHMDEGITLLYGKIDEIPKPPAPETVEVLAETRCRQRIIIERRTSLWHLERREPERKDSINHLPRPSLIGRTLYDLGAFSEHQGQHPGQVFTSLLKKGKHHLSPKIIDYLSRYERPDGTKDPAISADLGDQFTPRIGPLIQIGYAAKGSKGHYLTEKGRRLFEGWPDYEVSDDDIECLGELKSARASAGAKVRAAADSPGPTNAL